MAGDFLIYQSGTVISKDGILLLILVFIISLFNGRWYCIMNNDSIVEVQFHPLFNFVITLSRFTVHMQIDDGAQLLNISSEFLSSYYLKTQWMHKNQKLDILVETFLYVILNRFVEVLSMDNIPGLDPFLIRNAISSSDYKPHETAILSSRRRLNFPKNVREALKSWLLDHRERPYPSKEEKQLLALQTNISIKQLEGWLINGRRRYLNIFEKDKQTNALENQDSESEF